MARIVRQSEHDRIARLEDIEEIRRLTIRYAYGADRRNDPKVMHELFAEGAVWESDGFGVFRGRERILAGLRKIASTRVSRTLHYMIAPLVDIASHRRSARASWRLWELAHLKDETGSKFHPVMAGGDYTCKLIRIDGKWRLQHMRLNISTVVRCSPDSVQAGSLNRGVESKRTVESCSHAKLEGQSSKSLKGADSPTGK